MLAVTFVFWGLVNATLYVVSWSNSDNDDSTQPGQEMVVDLGDAIHSRSHTYKIGDADYRLQEKDNREIILLGLSGDGVVCNFRDEVIAFDKVLAVEQHLLKVSGEGELLKRVMLFVKLKSADYDLGQATFTVSAQDIGWGNTTTY